MEKQIVELYIKYGLDPIHYKNMTNDLFRLFNVSGRSEQLCRTFFPDGKTTSATKCQFCGKEKWEH